MRSAYRDDRARRRGDNYVRKTGFRRRFTVYIRHLRRDPVLLPQNANKALFKVFQGEKREKRIKIQNMEKSYIQNYKNVDI